MYIPKHFEITDSDEILSFLNGNPFGQLISTLNGKLFSSHIPFLINQDGSVLLGHLAKTNPQWKTIEDQEVLVTFQGAHDYISPSWYGSPGVPTWNYQAVHVYGNCSITQDREELQNIVNELTSIYESKLPEPWSPEYKESKLKGIVGVKVNVTDIQCKYKLSQNRSEEDRNEVISQLEQKGSITLAFAMKESEK
jgi:transcriptional regulator